MTSGRREAAGAVRPMAFSRPKALPTSTYPVSVGPRGEAIVTHVYCAPTSTLAKTPSEAPPRAPASFPGVPARSTDRSARCDDVQSSEPSRMLARRPAASRNDPRNTVPRNGSYAIAEVTAWVAWNAGR